MVNSIIIVGIVLITLGVVAGITVQLVVAHQAKKITDAVLREQDRIMNIHRDVESEMRNARRP